MTVREGAHPRRSTIETYRARERIERAFRLTKGAIRIRPIWKRKKEHIEAHVFICFLACLLLSIL